MIEIDLWKVLWYNPNKISFCNSGFKSLFCFENQFTPPILVCWVWSSFSEYVVICKDGSFLFFAKRKDNLYKIRLWELLDQKVSCLLSVKENHWLWHKKIGHASWRLISKLQKNNLVRGLPSMSYKDDLLCEACQKGK